MGGQCYRLPPSGPKQPLRVTPVGHTDVAVLPMGCEVRGPGSPTSKLESTSINQPQEVGQTELGRDCRRAEALEMERGRGLALCLTRAHASNSCVQDLAFPSFPSSATTVPLKVGQITVCYRGTEGKRYQLGHQSCWCLVSRPKPMAAQFKTTHKDSFMWQGVLNGPHPPSKRSALFSGNGTSN